MRSPARLPLTIALLLGAAACAKVATPPGGPADRDPPTIASDGVRPIPGSGGVAADEPAVIVFSERLDQRSVLRALRVWPSVDFRDVTWRGDTLSLVPDPAWAAGRNTIVRIGTGAKDRHGNRLAKAFQFHFTTKAVPDTGEITGRVWAGRERDVRRPVVLLAFDAQDGFDQLAAQDDETERIPHAMSEAGNDGEYRLTGLDTARAWEVFAIVDRNDDFRGDGRDEAEASLPEPMLFLDGARTLTAPDFLVGTIDSLGAIRGNVKADSGAVVFVAARIWLEATSDLPSGEIAGTDGPIVGSGAFELEVPTGASYRVEAFVDADSDSSWSVGETRIVAAEEASLRFRTVDEGLTFDLRAPEPEETLEIRPAAPPEEVPSEEEGD